MRANPAEGRLYRSGGKLWTDVAMPSGLVLPSKWKHQPSCIHTVRLKLIVRSMAPNKRGAPRTTLVCRARFAHDMAHDNEVGLG
jgi:hypothetical protein